MLFSNTFLLELVIWNNLLECTEAVVQRCSVKKVFLEISQNSQESTCARASGTAPAPGLRLATLLKKRLLRILRNF